MYLNPVPTKSTSRAASWHKSKLHASSELTVPAAALHSQFPTWKVRCLLTQNLRLLVLEERGGRLLLQVITSKPIILLTFQKVVRRVKREREHNDQNLQTSLSGTDTKDIYSMIPFISDHIKI